MDGQDRLGNNSTKELKNKSVAVVAVVISFSNYALLTWYQLTVVLSMRIDIENLLQYEAIPDHMPPYYAIDMKDARIAMSNSEGELVTKIENDRVLVSRAKIADWKLRAIICQGIVELAPPPKPWLVSIKDIDSELRDLLAIIDLPYEAILISPNTDAEFEISKRPRITNVFVNPIVPDGMIYGLPSPEFLGVTTHWQNGDNGMLIANAKGIMPIIISPVVQIVKGRKETIRDWMMLSEIIES